MVEAGYKAKKEAAKAEIQQATEFVHLHMHRCLPGCNLYLFTDGNTFLNSILLAMVKFPRAHTAENLACVKISLMEEWGM